MSEIADFLRARYAEAHARENSKRRQIPSVFDGHDVEIVRDFHGERILIDGHPYPIEKWREIATEPAPDPDVIADLGAKLRILDEIVPEIGKLEDAADGEWGVGDCATLGLNEQLLRILAQPFAGHPDHKGEEWAPG